MKNRLVTPKMLSTGNEERCSVVLFKRHLEKRPNEMKKSGSFSLTVIDKVVSSVCYKKTLNRKEHVKCNHEKYENSPLKDLCTEMNLANHSARKTVVKKLKSSGIPKCEIKNISQATHLPKGFTITIQETNESSRSFHEPLTTLVQSFKKRFKSTLSFKFQCIFECSRPCL